VKQLQRVQVWSGPAYLSQQLLPFRLLLQTSTANCFFHGNVVHSVHRSASAQTTLTASAGCSSLWLKFYELLTLQFELGAQAAWYDNTGGHRQSTDAASAWLRHKRGICAADILWVPTITLGEALSCALHVLPGQLCIAFIPCFHDAHK
jgi:hypothetical protein